MGSLGGSFCSMQEHEGLKDMVHRFCDFQNLVATDFFLPAKFLNSRWSMDLSILDVFVSVDKMG
jgi:hypothetical protein